MVKIYCDLCGEEIESRIYSETLELYSKVENLGIHTSKYVLHYNCLRKIEGFIEGNGGK